MQFLLTIFGIIKLILKIWFEKNQEKKKKYKEAYKEVKNGLKEKDASKITAGFDAVNRI